jgi:DNA ligase (NAD+)
MKKTLRIQHNKKKVHRHKKTIKKMKKRVAGKYTKKAGTKNKGTKDKGTKDKGTKDKVTKAKKTKKKVAPIFNIVEEFEKDIANITTVPMDVLANVTTDIAPIELSSIEPITKKIEQAMELKTKQPIHKTKTSMATKASMAPKATRLNEQFIDLMEKLSSLMLKQGESFRARAYQKAQETIMSYPEDITSVIQLKGLPNIGPTIMEKLNEYVQTGTLTVLEREKNNPVTIFGEIYGIGPKKASELVDKHGITTIEELRGKQDAVLNDIQKVGLKYYEDIMQRIPRAEINEYDDIFKKVFAKVAGPGSEARFEIVGSYRRGAQSSGDIDVIITSKTGQVFREFIDELIKMRVIVEVLSHGQTKCLVIAKLPGASVARRVDFLYTSPEEYPFSVLYFTGSKIFNTVMRGRALSLGYSLNEHGMAVMSEKKKGEKSVKGNKVDHVFHGERDIFDFLGMEYKEPVDRVDGRSVVIKSVAPPAPAPIRTVVVEKKAAKKVAKKMIELVVEEPNVEEPIVEEPIVEEPIVEETMVLKEAVKEKIPKKRTLKKKGTIVLLEEKEEKEGMNMATPEDNSAVLQHVQAFKKHGIHVLDVLSEKQLSDIIKEANKAFHFNKTPIMTDNEYDIVKEYLEKKFPTSEVLKEVGAPIIERNKVTLPYEMASMDKIKPDTGALTAWKQKYSGPYVLSCKLDGVSGMYEYKGGVAKLYTRGNGKVGQDISHLIPYLRFPNMKKEKGKEKEMAVRGEFVIPKSVFQEKYSEKFANGRNLVAGIVNRQTLDEKVHDIHFVAYEVIVPILKPSQQMQLLADSGFEPVMNKTVKDVTNEMLSELLVKWRSEYIYEIDGVIVSNDAIYERESGNPDHSFAFKMVLSDQIAEAKVVDVIWTPSKDGYLKPRVQIEPIGLGGVKIEYATGFNAAFIQQHKIGVGALIQIIRSGDVIPHIRSVTTPAEAAKMPAVPYKWNASHVDVMLEDIESDETVREKNIAGFFKGIEVQGLSSGNVARIITSGFDSVPAILRMTKADFEKAGFKTLAQKFVDGIRLKVNGASLITLMSSSNIFGRGFSEKRIETVLEAYPDILVSNDSKENKIQKIMGVKGMAKKTAEAFVDKIDMFVAFMQECGLQDKLVVGKTGETGVAVVVNKDHPLYKKSIVMTGVRDAAVIDALKSVGANLGTSVSKNTFTVIAKSADEDTGKAAEARRLGIPIMTPSQFLSTYFA